jgi:predicted DNA-binding transcriptional regulator AlpA
VSRLVRTAEKLQDHFGYPPRGMDAERAAAYLGLGRTKFLELVEDGRMPKPVRIEEELPRWDRHDLDAAWDDLKQKRHDPIERGRKELRRRIRRQQEGRPAAEEER